MAQNKTRVDIAYGLVLLITLFSLFLWVREEASAQGNRSCVEDIEKFCKSVGPGGQLKCLSEHEGELSTKCKAYVVEVRRRTQELENACKSDFEKFYKDVKPGGGRILNCLRNHENELSQDCKEKLPKPKP